ncbi:hypothetical protein BGZ81_004553, partial [Podila clonocystis]
DARIKKNSDGGSKQRKMQRIEAKQRLSRRKTPNSQQGRQRTSGLTGWMEFRSQGAIGPGRNGELEDVEGWKDMDLYLGLVPQKFGEIWKPIFGTSKTIACYMVG